MPVSVDALIVIADFLVDFSVIVLFVVLFSATLPNAMLLGFTPSVRVANLASSTGLPAMCPSFTMSEIDCVGWMSIVEGALSGTGLVVSGARKLTGAADASMFELLSLPSIESSIRSLRALTTCVFASATHSPAASTSTDLDTFSHDGFCATGAV